MDVATDVYEALKLFRQRIEIEADPDKQKMLNEMARRVDTAITKQEEELKKLLQNGQQQGGDSGDVAEKLKMDLLADAKDILGEWLDDTLGSTINEHSVFSKLARK